MNPPTRHFLWLSLLLLLPAANLPASDFVKVPVLDLFGSDDLPIVLRNRLKKAMAAQSGGNLKFRQQEIEGANHFFDDKNDELVDGGDDWLKTLP